MAEYLVSNIFKETKQYQHYDVTYITFKEAGNPINITGFTFTMEFRVGNHDGVSVLKLVLAAGQLEIVDIAGVKKLKINPFAIPTAGNIYYDLRVKDNSDIIKYHVGGVVKVTSSVTKQDN